MQSFVPLSRVLVCQKIAESADAETGNDNIKEGYILKEQFT